VSVRVFLDDNQEIELASADSDRPLLVGPFLRLRSAVSPAIGHRA
jgi:hypothetical protein